jgi:hypothetical protein
MESLLYSNEGPAGLLLDFRVLCKCEVWWATVLPLGNRLPRKQRDHLVPEGSLMNT